jgi:hypothetical protein
MMKAAPEAQVAKVLKPNDFNDYSIRCIGKHVTIKVNGLTTVDDDFPKMPDEGILAWQLHAGPAMEVTFRKIQFKELADERGWVQLFNGKDLTGWKVFPKGTGNWKVEDGVLTCSGPMSHLFSQRGDYENFHFRVEARINARGNSGQYFRAAFGSGYPQGYEAQIAQAGGDPRQWTGSLFGIAVIREKLHEPGAWFTQEVIANGDHITIKVNGKEVVSVRNDTYKRGHFALQHLTPATAVEFRKIEVKELPPRKPVSTVLAQPDAISDPIANEIKRATDAFEAGNNTAKKVLLAAFDRELAALPKGKGKVEDRLKLIEAVKAERVVFEKNGTISWSAPMRPATKKFMETLDANRQALSQSFDKAIDVYLKKNDTEKAKEYQVKKQQALHPVVLASWSHRAGKYPPRVIRFYSNARIDSPTSGARWVVKGNVLILRWPDRAAPGGVWQDICSLSADGKSYSGKNQREVPVWGAKIN